MRKRNVVVVGAAGYLGRHVVQALSEDYNVVPIDCLLWTNQPSPPGLVKLDMRHRADRLLVRDFDPDCIVYLGAVAHMAQGMDETDAKEHTYRAPMEMARDFDGVPFVFASSLSVFDRKLEGYPLYKHEVEGDLRFNNNAAILRFGTLFGPGVEPETFRGHLLLNRMVVDLHRHGECYVFNSGLRRPVLSVTQATNSVRYHVDHFLNPRSNWPGREAVNIYHTCGTVRQFADHAARVLGGEVVVRDKGPDTRNYGWGEFEPDSLSEYLRGIKAWVAANDDRIVLKRGYKLT